MKKSITIGFAITIGIIITFLSIQSLSPLLLGGKTYAGRNLFIRCGIFILFTSIFSTITYFLIKQIYPYIYKFFTSNKLHKLGYDIHDSKILFLTQWFVAGILFLGLVFIHGKIIIFPYQLDYREGAILLTTQALIKGINPYLLANQPLYTNVYGFLYNFLVYPLTLIFGNTLSLHRSISAIFIAGQIFLMATVMRHRHYHWFYVVAASIFLWIGQLYFVTPLSRPDTMGEFLFLAGFIIPFLGQFNRKSLIISILAGLLGFYTKPYFILSVLIMACYLFLFKSKQISIRYALLFSVLFGISALIINKIYPAYFLNVFFTNSGSMLRYASHLLSQTEKFFLDYWSLLIILIIIFIKFIHSISNGKQRCSLLFDLKKFNEPLLGGSGIDIFQFSLIILGVLVLSLFGWHIGSQMAYYYQLLSPFLLIITFNYLQSLQWQAGFIIPLLVVNLCTHAYANLRIDFSSYDNDGWKAIIATLDNKHSVLNSPISVSKMIQQDQIITNSGLTDCFAPLPEKPFYFYPDIQETHQTKYDYWENVENNISDKKYDVIMEDVYLPDLVNMKNIRRNYRQSERIQLLMPHTDEYWDIQLWVPQK